MKKTILFILITFTTETYSQNKENYINKQDFKPFDIINVIEINNNKNLIKNSNLTSTIIDKKTNPNKYNENLLFQVIDSIYFWEWDTSANIWKNTYRHIDIDYDENNSLTSYVRQKWNGTIWGNYDKRIYSFDILNNLTIDLYQEWNGTSWENSWRDTYTYDENNNLDNNLVELWNGTSWEYNSNYIYTYDTCNYLTSVVVQFGYDDILNNYYKYSYEYDINYNIILKLDQIWDGSIWDNNYQYISTFDSIQNKTNELLQKWNYENWENIAQYTFAYDTNNNNLSTLKYNWSGISWYVTERSIYEYDSNNNRLYELRQTWYNDFWNDGYQLFYSYDSNRNLISSTGENMMDSIWVIAYRSNFTYNMYNYRISESSMYWNSFDNSLYSSDSIYYYFHLDQNKTFESDKSDNIITIYPNPSNGKILIESENKISSVVVFNITGSLIYSDYKIFPESFVEVDLSQFERGIYLTIIRCKEKIYIKKIITQ